MTQEEALKIYNSINIWWFAFSYEYWDGLYYVCKKKIVSKTVEIVFENGEEHCKIYTRSRTWSFYNYMTEEEVREMCQKLNKKMADWEIKDLIKRASKLWYELVKE